MINSIAKFQPIQGLTKRQQSKLQRLIRNDEVHKIQNDYKCYKRKISKNKPVDQPEPRKMCRIDDLKHEQKQIPRDEPAVVVVQQGEQTNRQSSVQLERTKNQLKVLKPYNLLFPIEGGQSGFFNYIIGYVCTQKQKLLEHEYQDTSFLDSIEGKQLEILDKEKQLEFISNILLEKYKIKQPFDQNHQALMKKCMIENKTSLL